MFLTEFFKVAKWWTKIKWNLEREPLSAISFTFLTAVKTKNRNKASAVAGYLFADDQRGLSTPPENKETKRQKETKTMIETWSTDNLSERRTQQQITFWEPRQKFVSWWSTSLTCTRNSLFFCVFSAYTVQTRDNCPCYFRYVYLKIFYDFNSSLCRSYNR